MQRKLARFCFARGVYFKESRTISCCLISMRWKEEEGKFNFLQFFFHWSGKLYNSGQLFEHYHAIRALSNSRECKVIVVCRCNAMPCFLLFLKCPFQIQDRKREIFFKTQYLYQYCNGPLWSWPQQQKSQALDGEICNVLQQVRVTWVLRANSLQDIQIAPSPLMGHDNHGHPETRELSVLKGAPALLFGDSKSISGGIDETFEIGLVLTSTVF